MIGQPTVHCHTMTDFPRQVQVNHHLWVSTRQILNRQSRLNLMREIQLLVDSIDVTAIGERERDRHTIHDSHAFLAGVSEARFVSNGV